MTPNPLPEKETVEAQTIPTDDAEGFDPHQTKEFTQDEIEELARASMDTYRQWLDEHGVGCDEVST